MSVNRKMRRARKARRTKSAEARLAGKAKSRDELRRQSSAQRFGKPGSDRLWAAMLGWDDARVARIRLADAVHDGALWKDAAGSDPSTPPYDPAGVLGAFTQHCPKTGARLEPSAVDAAVDAWRASGDGYDPQTPAPKWHDLAGVAEAAGLGRASPADYQQDWEVWISMSLAAPARTVLLSLLGQTEQAALTLNEVSKSERIAAVATMTRLMWSALAYGDERTFEKIRTWSSELLAGGQQPPEGGHSA